MNLRLGLAIAAAVAGAVAVFLVDWGGSPGEDPRVLADTAPQADLVAPDVVPVAAVARVPAGSRRGTVAKVHPRGASDPSLPRTSVVVEVQTAGAMDLPAMATMDPKDSRYDPVVEAEQAIHPFEEALVAARPLTPDKWKALLETFRVPNGAVIRRASELRKVGHATDARELMEEWSRIYSL